MTRLLYSSDNVSGMYLEDIARKLRAELVLKNLSGYPINRDVELNYLRSNRKIINLLKKIERLQVAAVNYAKRNSGLVSATLSGVPILYCPMTHDLYSLDHNSNPEEYGAEFSNQGFYIIVGRGTVLHRAWWLPENLFNTLVDK